MLNLKFKFLFLSNTVRSTQTHINITDRIKPASKVTQQKMAAIFKNKTLRKMNLNPKE